ncbi:MAG: multiphosphoryl transfer protein, partial [Pseudonocardiales bacterium]|nr:multiphosphoryl transfer protein [Pseudonocardiales bacterium]
MVGIVVVSHSRPLADAAVALATEMLTGQPVPIEVAAGLDEHTFGTDAAQIVTAITDADAGGGAGSGGVVVLMDLGSAVLSAELALELLDDELRERVLLCPAPLVEGLVVAAVSAAGGASRAEVAAEASAALAGKLAQLGEPAGGGPADTGAVDAGAVDAGAADSGTGTAAADVGAPADSGTGTGGPRTGLTGSFTVVNPHGLHARPAATLASRARGFDARIELRNRTTGSGWVPATSLSKLGTLGALAGHQLDVRAEGSQAREALDQLLELAARAFDEQPAGTTASRSPSRETGTTASRSAPGGGPRAPIGASPGLGIGLAFPFGDTRKAITDAVPETGADTLGADIPAEDPATEWRRLEAAMDTARQGIERVRARAADQVGDHEAGIFDAHLALLDDPELR